MVTSYIHDNFSTAVFKMAMKHYHYFGYDAQSRKLLKLLSENSGACAWGAMVHTRKAECRVRNGSMYTCKHIAFSGKCTGIEPDSIHFWICPHLDVRLRESPASLCIVTSYPLFSEEKWSELLHCDNTAKIKRTSWDSSSDIQQCRYCRTEYKAGFKHDGRCTFKFTMTIWKDLGQGPEAEEWKAHFPFQDERACRQPSPVNGRKIASILQEGDANKDWR